MLAVKNSLKFAVRTQSPLYHLSIRNASFVRDIYKKINYDAPFSMEDKELILQRLNLYSSKQLESCVSKVAAKRILDYRKKAGSFEAVEQLLDLEKIETTSLEKLCRMLMKEEGSEEESNETDLAKKYKFLSKDIKPSFGGFIPESSVLGLRVNVGSVSYALINRYDLLEWGSISLTPAEGGAVSQSSLLHNVLFKKVQEVVEHLPEADFCIEEELLPVLPRDPYLKLKYNMCKTRSYVDCLLQQSGKIGSDCIHQMPPRTLDNTFKLKVGSERISLRAKFPEIREQNNDKDMPFYLNISPQQMQDFKNCEGQDMELIAGACLQALAFRLAGNLVINKKAAKSGLSEKAESSTESSTELSKELSTESTTASTQPLITEENEVDANKK